MGDRALEVRLAILEAQRTSDREALDTAAAELARRLSDLNHAHERADEAEHHTVTLDKFDATRAGDAKALALALLRADENTAALAARVSDLETWKAKATGVAAVLVLFAGLVGAAVASVLGG